MVAEALDIAKIPHLAITLDRSKGQDVVMASTEGGVEIEEVAATNPENRGFGLTQPLVYKPTKPVNWRSV